MNFLKKLKLKYSIYDTFDMLIKNNERFDQSFHQLFKYFFEIKPCRQGKVIYFASFLIKYTYSAAFTGPFSKTLLMDNVCYSLRLASKTKLPKTDFENKISQARMKAYNANF